MSAPDRPALPNRSGSTSPLSRRGFFRRMRRRRGLLPLFAGVFFFAFVFSIARWIAALRQPAPLMPLAYAYVPSPNCDDRPPDAVISCVVLHATVSPTVEDTEHIFLDTARKVSAHFVVGKEGQVVQMVPIEKRAWHAGVSVLDGVPRLNDYSVGIEMVNLNDGKDPFTDAQYRAVAGIIRFLRSRYMIPDTRLVSHAQIALPPGRKSDPLGFDFEKLRGLLMQQPPQQNIRVE